MLVCYLPVGSEDATKWYVEQALAAGVGFVNCLPVFIAREDYWDKRFKEAGLPIIGDDIKSQVGATIVHRQLARLFHDRGVRMERTSQLNVGGNMDFYNMLERERLESKKISKTNAVTSIMGHELPADDVHVGPSDYVAVADRPQVGPHPPRGQSLRRRAAQRRAQARGLGLAQLGRHRHRRGADDQAGAQPRHRRPARRPLQLPDEVAAQPAARRRGPRADRGVHRRARAQQAKPAVVPSSSSRARDNPWRVAEENSKLTIAQVGPHRRGTPREVNEFVERLSEELDARGHRVISVPRLGSRNLEQLLRTEPPDIVHVHEPFAPSVASAALRHSHSLNVGTFHEPAERVLSTQVARPLVEIFFGRLDARTASSPQTAALLERYFRGSYELIPRAKQGPTPSAAGRRSPTSSSASTDASCAAAPALRRPSNRRQTRHDRRRPPHAHRPLARTARRRSRCCWRRRATGASARSRSPTTTRSPGALEAREIATGDGRP